jgi:hypothetical protein
MDPWMFHPGIWAVVSFAKHLRKQREILNMDPWMLNIGNRSVDDEMKKRGKFWIHVTCHRNVSLLLGKSKILKNSSLHSGQTFTQISAIAR